MPIARLAVAACALLVLAGCGVGQPSAAAPTSSTASPSAAAERSRYSTPEGVRKSIGNGVALSAATPTTFTPSDTAYPRARRAMAIDVAIDNGGTIAFQPSQLTFDATMDGASAKQVIDSTQGYYGVSAIADEVAPGETVRFSIAFSMPEKSCAVRVWVRPDTPGTVTIELYDGVV